MTKLSPITRERGHCRPLSLRDTHSTSKPYNSQTVRSSWCATDYPSLLSRSTFSRRVSSVLQRMDSIFQVNASTPRSKRRLVGQRGRQESFSILTRSWLPHVIPYR